MRILYLTDGFPYPLTSGRLRHYHFVRELSRRHEISLLSTVPPNHPREHDAALAEWVERVETFVSHRHARGLLEKAASRLRSIVTFRPQPGLARLCRRAADLHRARPYHVVLNAHLDSPIHTYLRGVPLLFDVCDALSLRALGELRHARPHRTPGVVLKYLEARAIERAGLRRAPHVIFCSRRDAEWAAGIIGRRAELSVIPNGVDTYYWRRTTPSLTPDCIVFAGVLGYPPNEDAAFTLIEEVLPIVRRKVPGVRLVLAGRDPSRSLVRAAGRQAGCRVVPNLPDLRPILEEAAVFAAPIRFAAGIQNKLLQAMAMEIPVVTTPIGAAGLLTPAGDAPPVAIRRSARALADDTIEALEGIRRDPTPHRAGRQFVESHFRWDDQANRLEALLQASAQR